MLQRLLNSQKKLNALLNNNMKNIGEQISTAYCTISPAIRKHAKKQHTRAMRRMSVADEATENATGRYYEPRHNRYSGWVD